MKVKIVLPKSHQHDLVLSGWQHIHNHEAEVLFHYDDLPGQARVKITSGELTGKEFRANNEWLEVIGEP